MKITGNSPMTYIILTDFEENGTGNLSAFLYYAVLSRSRKKFTENCGIADHHAEGPSLRKS